VPAEDPKRPREIPLHEARIDAHHAHAVVSHEVRVPSRIGRDTVEVVPAVHFDDELQQRSIEVDDVRVQHMLPTELHAAKPTVPKRVPEDALRRRRSLALLASKVKESE